MNSLVAPATVLHYPLFRSSNTTNLPRFQSTLSTITISPTVSHSLLRRTLSPRAAASDEADTQTVDEEVKLESETTEGGTTSSFSTPLDKELKKVGAHHGIIVEFQFT